MGGSVCVWGGGGEGRSREGREEGDGRGGVQSGAGREFGAGEREDGKNC